MKTVALKTFVTVVLVAGIASNCQATVVNPFNPKPSNILVQRTPGLLAQQAPRRENGEWFQGSGGQLAA